MTRPPHTPANRNAHFPAHSVDPGLPDLSFSGAGLALPFCADTSVAENQLSLSFVPAANHLNVTRTALR